MPQRVLIIDVPERIRPVCLCAFVSATAFAQRRDVPMTADHWKTVFGKPEFKHKGVQAIVFVAGKKLLYRATLHELVGRLDAMRFVRVHRSAVVSIESIVQLEARSHGEFDVVLKHGSRTRMSRTYRAHLEKRLGQPL